MFADVDQLLWDPQWYCWMYEDQKLLQSLIILLQKLGVILKTQTTSASMFTIYFVKVDFEFRSNCLLSIPSFLVHIWKLKHSCYYVSSSNRISQTLKKYNFYVSSDTSNRMSKKLILINVILFHPIHVI